MLPPSAWSLAGRNVEQRRRRPQHQTARRTRTAAADAPVTIRRARAEDSALLAALAALDSASPLGGEAIVAEVGGAPVAAAELRSGRTIADPFIRSAEIVGLLRLRVDQLAR